MNEWTRPTTTSSPEARIVETLAELLAAASDTVTAARELRASSPARSLRIEACAATIYDEVETLLQELAD
jgi:hypothetical protein